MLYVGFWHIGCSPPGEHHLTRCAALWTRLETNADRSISKGSMVEMLKMTWLRLGLRSQRGKIADASQAGSLAELASQIISLFRNDLTCDTATSPAENRNALIAIQWFVAVGTSYLILSSQAWSLDAPLPLLLIFLCIVSAPALQRLPLKFFSGKNIEAKLLILNSIIILSAIGLTQSAPWDLLALFFFCVFIAATGENLIHIVVGCTLLSIIFLIFLTSRQVDLAAINSDLLLRVPFMFGISVLYGHLTNQVKRDKKRIEQLKQTEEFKRQVVCALAHDIKAPLSVILGHAELLAGSFGGRPNPAEQSLSFKCIRENIDRIVNLVIGFLNVSELVTPKAEASKTAVEINPIFRDVIRQQTVALRKKDLNVRMELADDLKPCHGDQNQLERVFWNLIDNAIKYTPASGAIALTSRMISGNISLSISDSGVGISKRELPNLFREFKRLEGSANTEGTGLGLFIVKTILDDHNGSITVQSEEGLGTTFNIQLPPRV
jgi:signal transduction histidine kinase